MNEEIEYAEMLEIPVSTVNVIPKQRRKRRAKPKAAALPDSVETERGELKASLIARVNDKVSDESESGSGAESESAVEPPVAPAEALVNYETPDPFSQENGEEYAERIDTVRLLALNGKKKRRFALFSRDEKSENPQNDTPVYEFNDRSRLARNVLKAEFALACALSATVFLTNVFMPNSGVNTFFRSLGGNRAAQTGDGRGYEDFELSGVVSALSDAELTLSPTGVLSFTDECMVYPAANGKIADVSKLEDGTYVVKISHSDTFTGVVEGLDQVYYAVGDDVRANVPMGFSKGEREVQVTMYSKGELLNCFEMTEDNCLVWVERD